MPIAFHDKMFTFTQPDGTKVTVRGSGDQHYAVFETLDGYTVVRDPASGYYQYARLDADGTALLPTGVQVGRVNPEVLGVDKHIRIKREAARAEAAAAASGLERKRRWEERLERRRRQLHEALAGAIPSAPPTQGTTGDYVGLCLLIDFPDVPGTILLSEVDDFCNKMGYAGFGNNGSVYDYFFDVSRGRLRYTNVVTAYYTAIHPRSYYTDETIPQPRRARELIREGLADLKANGFDFTPLSADSEGYIHALNVFYAGTRVNNWAQGLWPHSFHLGIAYELAPGRNAFDYQFTDMGDELALATFCHENGHMICDFPDLYDYGYQSRGVGQYCLMCFGGPDEKNPTRVSAYLKYKAGWADNVTPIAPGMNASISASRNDFFIHAKNLKEYFIIENRQAMGRDETLPSSGLAIWHVDEEGTNDNEQMTSELHYECSIEQADNEFDLERNEDNGDAQDLFNDHTRANFGDATMPNSRWWDGTPSGVEILNIGPAMETMTFSTLGAWAEDKIHVSSDPAKPIADDDDAGVEDVIHIGQDAVVSSLEVDVDITHTYRGDLRVTLIPPSGATVVLHERQGGSANDLKQTFDAVTTPALAIVTGQPVRGDWRLRVQDLASADVGKLNHWELRIRRFANQLVRLEESPGERIPDNDTNGIERVLMADAAGTVREVSVNIDITHTYIRDLVVTLTSPGGRSVALHNRIGGSADNIIKTYTTASMPALDAIRGDNIQGNWRLKVVDLEGQDIGKLNRWGLSITRQS